MAGLKTVFSSTGNPTETWNIRATQYGPGIRKALGQAASLIYQKRKEILQETIYDREPKDRPLTGTLKGGEYITFANGGMEVGNRVDYAAEREAMTGISVSYNHVLDSHWAHRAVSETAVERRNLMRRAHYALMHLKGSQ